MERTEFKRVTPESVGISSASIQRLLDRLESGFTEMHGIQIMRHGSICAEGWWNPYAPGIRHNLMSVTKTYAATAVGIAFTEGLLDLSDRIVDIFPEHSPPRPDEMLKKLTVRDVLCMGCGMESTPCPTVNWIRDFIATPIIHVPGTRFFYNSLCSTLLGAIIKKLTGMGLSEYLKSRLFDKIGIDSDNLRWVKMPDGLDAGGAGLYATTEDNLRLMKLYLDGGVFEGERILSEIYVNQAVTKQIDTSTQAVSYPFAKDNFCGYGFQIWMCRPEGVYRADGAMGQFAIVAPKQDMIISITETGKGIDGPQKTLDAIWMFLDEVADDTLPEDFAASSMLQKRMASLALPRPSYRPFSPETSKVSGKSFEITDGILRFEDQTLSVFCGSKLSKGISRFRFNFSSNRCALEFTQDGTEYCVNIATDGSRALNELKVRGNTATLTYFCGAWSSDDTFTISVRWIETSFEKEISFRFNGTECVITTRDPLMSYGPLGELNYLPVKAALCK
jgi:CubicO group peptidase (beta-lactamase class C family)